MFTSSSLSLGFLICEKESDGLCAGYGGLGDMREKAFPLCTVTCVQLGRARVNAHGKRQEQVRR